MNRYILIAIVYLVTILTLHSENSDNNDLYLNLKLFSMNYQTIDGEMSYNYSQFNGLSNEMINLININNEINNEILQSSENLRKGHIFYWVGFAGILASPTFVYNPLSNDETVDLTFFFSSLTISTVISFIGIKYFNNSRTHTNKAVTLYNQSN